MLGLRFWFPIYGISMIIYMAAYVGKSSILAEIPAFFITPSVLVITSAIIVSLARAAGSVELIVFFFIMTLLVRAPFIESSSDVLFLLKLVIYHLMFLCGTICANENSVPSTEWRGSVFFLLILPVFFFLVFIRGSDASDVVFAFNRNPFAAYTMTASLLILPIVSSGRGVNSFASFFLLLGSVLLFNGTLGSILSVCIAGAVAILVWNGLNLRLLLSSFLVLCLALLMIGTALNFQQVSEIEAVKRIQFVSALFSNVWTYYDGSWLNLDMSTAVGFAPEGDLDMSAIFRIIHWLNILQLHVGEGPLGLFFGSGLNWIDDHRNEFTYNLSAHNEFVRVLVEQGIIVFTFYLVVFSRILWRIRNTLEFVPILSFFIFLGTENTLNDFAATTLFFLLLGYIYQRHKTQKYAGYTKAKSQCTS